MSPEKSNLAQVISVNITGLSPACRSDLEKAITETLQVNARRIRADVKDSNYTPGSEATQNMLGWAGAAETECHSVRQQFKGEGAYDLTVKVLVDRASNSAVLLKVGRVMRADDLASNLAIKAASMVMGMFHFEAHLEHVEGADGYDAYGGPERIENWICDGR